MCNILHLKICSSVDIFNNVPRGTLLKMENAMHSPMSVNFKDRNATHSPVCDNFSWKCYAFSLYEVNIETKKEKAKLSP